jgi:hypothetical protein
MHNFKDVPSMDKASLDAAFSSGDTEKICNAMVSMAYHEHDWHWAQEKCLSFLQYSDIQISGLAATCLGHIARIHRQLDKEKVLRSLREKACINPEVAGRIEDALDDIEAFVKN